MVREKEKEEEKKLSLSHQTQEEGGDIMNLGFRQRKLINMV